VRSLLRRGADSSKQLIGWLKKKLFRLWWLKNIAESGYPSSPWRTSSHYNKSMVALSENLPLHSKTALRARGATLSCASRRAKAVKSSNCIEIRRFTYDARRRLGLCSNERIRSNEGTRFATSDSFLYGYSPFAIDPSGKIPCSHLAIPGGFPGSGTGSVGDPVDGDGTNKALCDMVNCLLQTNAIGRNQELLDHWLGGSGSKLFLDFDDFDSLGTSRSDVISQFGSDLAGLATSLKCNKSLIYKWSTTKPAESNRTNLLITPMIYGWRFWYDCKGTATKKCNWCGSCRRIEIDGRCFFHAFDTVNFWPGKDSTFYLPYPGIHIRDRLVRACNPKGKGFDVEAHGAQEFTLQYTCKGLQILH
jgi:hypothetical protein